MRSQVENATVISVNGEEVQLPVGDYQVSLCCQSDAPGAVDIVKAAREIVDEFNGYLPEIQAWQDRTDELNAVFHPAFSAMYETCRQAPLDINRWAGTADSVLTP